jgi:HKD family nuclease
MSEPSYILQSPTSLGAQLHELERQLAQPGLKRVRIGVAYVRWDGIGLIATALEALLKRGGRVELIFGADNGVTTPDALLYGMVIRKLFPTQTYIGVILDKYGNSIFHPKFYEFRHKDDIFSIIGSANLTGGGMLRNTELSTVIDFKTIDNAAAEAEKIWDSIKSSAIPVTIPLVRLLARSGKQGSERRPSGEEEPNLDKPFPKNVAKVKPKPLFKKILGFASAPTKIDILKDLDSLSDPPKSLHLQINKYETGGSTGRPGYQVQLPVATLGAFFGVGQNQSRMVKFIFPKESVNVTLSHFENNTHRVRLRPILDIKRPAILKFTRIGDDTYKVVAIPVAKYQSVLKAKCVNQTSANSRRWGIE